MERCVRQAFLKYSVQPQCHEPFRVNSFLDYCILHSHINLSSYFWIGFWEPIAGPYNFLNRVNTFFNLSDYFRYVTEKKVFHSLSFIKSNMQSTLFKDLQHCHYKTWSRSGESQVQKYQQSSRISFLAAFTRNLLDSFLECIRLYFWWTIPFFTVSVSSHK